MKTEFVRGSTVGSLIETMRPRQWIKNLVVFAGLIFSKSLLDVSTVLGAGLGFLLFCLLSGTVYIINDLVDMENDKQHPTKRDRPLPSGRLTTAVAVCAAAGFTVVGLASSFLLLGGTFGLIALSYYVLIVAYSFVLKQVVILDVFAVSIGFVLRAWAGTAAIGVELSPWLSLCTLLGALFLALSKRRHELTSLAEQAVNHRRSLAEYSPHFLDQMIAVVTASTVMSYSVYTLSDRTYEVFHTRNLIYTVPFVLYGIFRYLYLVYKKAEGGNPTELFLTDKSILACILLYFLAVYVIVYA